MPKIKKYLTKTDKFRDKISPEYAKFLRTKYRKRQWKKKARQKVIDTLPNRLSQHFNHYNFSKMINRKSIILGDF